MCENNKNGILWCMGMAHSLKDVIFCHNFNNEERMPCFERAGHMYFMYDSLCTREV